MTISESIVLEGLSQKNIQHNIELLNERAVKRRNDVNRAASAILEQLSFADGPQRITDIQRTLSQSGIYPRLTFAGISLLESKRNIIIDRVSDTVKLLQSDGDLDS